MQHLILTDVKTAFHYCEQPTSAIEPSYKKGTPPMYNIYNDSNELIAKDLTEDQVITFANDEFAETDNSEDAIENDLLFYDNIYDAQESLEAFSFTLVKK